MKDKIYEMEDDYKQAVANLLEFIKLRDLTAESLKTAAPDKLLEGQEMLADMDKQIETTEAILAKEYDAYQKYRKDLEKEAEMMDTVMETMQKYYILVKHRMPEKLGEVKTAIFTNWTEDEIQNFYDEAAIIEATRLEEILGGAKADG